MKKELKSKITLTVDEDVQGTNEEFESIDGLINKLVLVLDKSVTKIIVKKEAQQCNLRASNS